VDCREPFLFNAAFYAERDLPTPKRCQVCRIDRRTRRKVCYGDVTSVGDRFGFVRLDGEDHARFAPAVIRADGFEVGDSIRCTVDPTEEPQPGRALRAFDVRRA
jgi:hypothetical protein